LKILLTALALTLATGTAGADEISDSIDAASAAYAEGDYAKAAKDLRSAQSAIADLQSAAIALLLPPAADGFTREDSPDFGAGMAMFGGGSGAEVRYTKDDVSFTMSIMADNDMVSGMLGMFSQPEMLAMMGKVEEVEGASVVTAEDGSLMSVINGRYMLSASGAPTEVMMPFVKAIDFAKMAEMAAQ
jgi:hypothetical protein